MIRIAYFSHAKEDISPLQLSEILTVARRNNTASDITGMLIYYKQAFLQILEGPEDNVMACFDRISRDPRHSDLHSLKKGPAKTRAFSNWSMGLAKPSALYDMPPESLHSIAEISQRLDQMTELDISQGKRRVAELIKGFVDQHALA